MADKGIFTAVSGAMAQSTKLDTIANNIANANTTAFKRDQQVFKEYLTSYEKAPDVIQVPRVPASVESFYDMNGGDKSLVDVDGTYTDFNQGQIKATGNSHDLAIEGKALFEVLGPNGVQYTRNGSFTRNNEGLLVTKEGFPVLMAGAGDPVSRHVNLPEGTFSVGTNGTILSNGESLGNLSMVESQNANSLTKLGSSRFILKDGYPAPVPSTESKIHQGFLETSNVNIIREMTDMITTTRTFESAQKAIQAYDQMNGKLINEVPKF